ncbi:MAG: leucine-rich repeat protein [Clostridiales bacterium]|nr:leucine-rich repeat protein [Clostridiales bacterium]
MRYIKLILPVLALALVFCAVSCMDDESYGAVTNPPSGSTQVGDLYYKVSGSSASVVAVSSTSLTSVVIPDTVNISGTDYPVTTIADYVFSELTDLEEVVIGDNITSVGSYAFQRCTSLSTVTFGKALTSVGAYAFNGCTSFTTAIINSIHVGNYYNAWFSHADALTNVTFGDTVQTIEGKAFYQCRAITSIVLPDSVTSIGIQAFGLCTSLSSVTLGNSVTSIGNSAFGGCTSLASISLPDSVTSLGTSVFGSCTALSEVTLSKNIPDLKESSFQKCTSLTSISIPDSVTVMGQKVFQECSNLRTVELSNNLTAIPQMAFYQCTSLQSIFIPQSVTSIGTNAFFGCTALTSVVIDDSPLSIGSGAFQKCSSLASLDLGEAVTSIGNYAFKEDVSLTAVDLPDTVTSIEPSVFSDCTSLRSVTLGDSVTSIGSYAFRNSALESIDLPDSLTTIGDMAFSGADFVSVSIPGAVTSIGTGVFGGCRNLMEIKVSEGNPNYADQNGILFNKGITTLILCPPKNPVTTYSIPDTVTSLENGAFAYNETLTSISGSSIESVGTGVFRDCKALSSFTVDGSYPYIQSDMFNGCVSLTSFTMPDSITAVSNLAFSSCVSLTSVTFNDSVTGLGRQAFDGCISLESIVFPSTLTSIGQYAFRGCNSLVVVNIPDAVFTIGYGAFARCDSLTAINVDPNNNSFSSEDGVLYNKAKTKLIQYPAEKTDSAYNLPDTVTSMDEALALIGCTHLTAINVGESNVNYSSEDGVLFDKAKTYLVAYPAGKTDSTYTVPDSVTSINSGAFSMNTHLTAINVGENNTRYTSEDGVLYMVNNGAKVYMVQYPAGKTGSTYVIPDSVNSLGTFEGNPYISSIVFNDTVSSIYYDYSFRGCTSLTSLILPPTLNASTVGFATFYQSSLKQVLNLSSVDLVADPHGLFDCEVRTGSEGFDSVAMLQEVGEPEKTETVYTPKDGPLPIVLGIIPVILLVGLALGVVAFFRFRH